MVRELVLEDLNDFWELNHKENKLFRHTFRKLKKEDILVIGEGIFLPLGELI